MIPALNRKLTELWNNGPEEILNPEERLTNKLIVAVRELCVMNRQSLRCVFKNEATETILINDERRILEILK